ncbi:MAG: hypothetical protein RLZZ127_40 [Planctomycetota bacterium]|jgi:hypothetical protein
MTFDSKAAAAGDAPQQPAPAPAPQPQTQAPKPTDAQIKQWMEDLLVLLGDSEDGTLDAKAVERFGKNRGGHQAMIVADLQAIKAIEIVPSPAFIGLTTIGWREVLRIKSARSALELKRKDDELAAHKKYHSEEQMLLNEIKSAEATVESKKGALQAAKEDLASAHEALAAHVAGGVQTTFIPEPKKDAKADPAAGVAQEWAKILPPVDPKSVRVWPAKGCPDQKTITTGQTMPEAMKQEKRKVEPIEAFGIPWIVSALWIEEKTGSSRANLLPLLTKDEWQQLHEKTLGRAVEGFDQTDDAKHLRQKGGAWCGLVVRHGRQVYVVGPQSSAVHVVHPAPVPAEKKG